jgi:DNA invertase Pin-like site-specific DNA recombinase
MAKLGYARISRDVQDLGKQVDALVIAGCDRIYQDTISGAKDSRPELDRMLVELVAGDTLVICKLDRLGRNVRHLLNVIADLEGRGVGFVSLGDSIDMSTAAGRLMFTVLAAVAEFERALIMERTKATVVRLKAQGVQLGRRQDERSKLALELIRIGKGRKDVVRETGVTLPTYYRLVRRVAGGDLPL